MGEFAARYGPWAVVTGAAQGVGLAFTEALIARGLGVVMVDLNPRLADVADSLGGEDTARPVIADLAGPSWVRSLDEVHVEPPAVTSDLPALTAPLVILKPNMDHWILFGSLMEDLRRVREEIDFSPIYSGIERKRNLEFVQSSRNDLSTLVGFLECEDETMEREFFARIHLMEWGGLPVTLEAHNLSFARTELPFNV